MSSETIGRWERGEWKDGPPHPLLVAQLARESGLLELLGQIEQAEESDPATRFAVAARREAERRRGRPAPGPSTRRDAGAGGEAS